MKRIHFIGICGVGMGALAIMMKRKGWQVTGSDVGFYPPISTHLKNSNIDYYAGWHPEKIGAHSPLPRGSQEIVAVKMATPPSLHLERGGNEIKPDLVVVGNVAGSENPEWKFVQEQKIPFVSYPELIKKELVKKNSIVCAGTYGKTSSTAMLAWILINANFNPAYMFGGLAQTPKLASDDLGGDWSVLEGDEYKTSRWDNGAKFFHYSPTHLLLTAVKWDHADIYPTEQEYFDAFKKLIKMIPDNGLIVASESVKGDIVKLSNCQIVKYGKSDDCDYKYFNVKTDTTGLGLEITHKNILYKIKTGIIGEFQADNIAACFALACEIGIKPEKIIESIASFGGIKRRLEKRGQTKNHTVVYDDIAHSPAKVQSVLETLNKIYKESKNDKEKGILQFFRMTKRQNNSTAKIFCVFEPNTGNREPQAAPAYDNAFKNADTVIIPKLTKLKTATDSNYLDGENLTKIISQTHKQTLYIDDDEKLLEYLNKNAKAQDVIVFCGSHSFRNMIEELTNTKE